MTRDVASPPIPMPPEDRERVDRLAERVGVAFVDRLRALAALTHKSYVNEHRDGAGEDNERLEFLGDAVIDLLASVYLVEHFPAAREGELSKLRAAVVDEAGLAAIGRALGLGELLRLGRGEELTGGREKASLLADATEAVIAAVFLDGGLGAAQEAVKRFLDEAYARASAGELDRDFKTQLQELGQSRHRLSPRYRVVAEIGPDHAKTFEIEVEMRGRVLGKGSGRSKKDAEQAAARVALSALAAGAEVPPAPAPAAVETAAPPVVVPGAPSAPVPPEERREGPAGVESPAEPAPPPPPARGRKGTRKPRRAPAPKAPARKPAPRKKPAPRSRKIAEPRGRR